MSKRRHVPEVHDEHAGGDERWLLTYADMITLLLALFIVLFSVSTINLKKFNALALGLHQTFDPKPGILPGSNGLEQNSSLVKTAGNAVSQQRTVGQLMNPRAPAPSATTPAPYPKSALTAAKDQAQLAHVQQRLTAALNAKGLKGVVASSLGQGELTLQILDDKVLFPTGSATLGASGNRVIDAVASVLAPIPNVIDVNGYTDNQPVTGGPYTTNEELSAVRAVNVVLRLSQSDGISPARLAATGFGDTRPVAPNNSPAHMALNRRIDIDIVTLDRSP